MQDSTPAIVFEDIEKSFGSLKVLQGISGSIQRGEVLAVIGSSGCGKSTLLRCFNRLEKINKGRLVVNEIDLSHPLLSQKQLRRLRTQVGMVFQQFNLFPHLSVLENLMLAPRQVLGKSRQEADEQARFYLQKVGLAEKAEVYPEQLSGGQKQRVAIARSLCMNPQIMLFDEPTSALDPELVGEVLQVVESLAAEGMTLLMVTHEMNFARKVADRLVFMHQGRVHEIGPPDEVFSNPQTPELKQFLGMIQ